jgi:hypothetical protein
LPTAGIVDNAVTLAKMAGITRGSIIYGNASGDPTALAKGCACEVLTSDGTDIAWAAAGGGGPCQASKCELECESDIDKYAPPDLIKHSPGVAKFWVKWEQGGGHSSAVSYNSDSVTDGGAVGDTDHVITTDFSGTNYVIASGSDDNGSTGFSTNWTGGTMAAGTLTTITRQNSNGNAVDIDHVNIILYGDQ